MNRILLLIVIIQGVIMGAKVDSINIKDIEIPIVFEESKVLPTFDLKLIFTNSGYISDKKSGVAKISANLLNEGTKKLGSVQFASLLDNRAIHLSTVSGFETFVIEVSSLKSEYIYGLELLKSLLESPNITKKALDKVKLMNISSLMSKEADFDYIASKELIKNLFKDTLYQNGSIRSKEDVEKITLKDVNNFLHNHLTLKNLIVVSGGDISIDELKSSITPLLKSIRVGLKSSYDNFSPNSNSKTITTIKDTKQAYIYFGSPFHMNPTDKDRYKSKVASFILGSSGFGSRMMEEIRVKRGLAYSAYSRFNIDKTKSYFSGYLQTKIENQEEAIKVVREILSDFIENGVTQEELDSAKDFLIGSEPLRNETLSQRLSTEFNLYYQGLDTNYTQKELNRIKKLKLKDLNNFIKSHKEILDITVSIVTNKS